MRDVYLLLNKYRSFNPNPVRVFLFSAFLLFSPALLLSQEIILNGNVFNKATNQILNNVSVQEKSSSKGTITDRTGSFRLILTEGDHNLVISHLGFETIDTVILLSEDIEISLYLRPVIVALGEVRITSDGSENSVSSSEMGGFLITRKEFTKLPTLLGEADPLGLLRLTPGVQSGSEGNVGFNVRGGGSDQNLILYDNALIYNPGHLLGFFSVFNPEMVRDVSIIKSGIPARYGGKLSSVIMIKSYKGNNDSVEVLGSIGLVASRLTVSTPVFGKKGTLILGARHTYLGLFVEPVIRNLIKTKSFFNKNNNYDFYDLNAGVSFNITRRDVLSLTAYSGRDKYKMLQEGTSNNNLLKWGNSIGSIQWNHEFNNKTIWNTNFSMTNYIFNLEGSQSDYFFKLISSVKDFRLKSDISVSSGKHKIITGFEVTEHSFIPNKIDAQANEFILNFGQFSTLSALEGGIFIDDEYQVTSNLTIAGGLRFSFFDHHGPYKEYNRNSLDQITDTLFYPRNKSLAFYANPEPRIVLKYQINSNSSFKASYMRIAQYVHLATSASVSLPTDIWIPSTSVIKPMIGNQVSIGYLRNIHKYDFEFSSELYYKTMNNKLEFLRGIVYNSIYGNIEDNIATGFARSYGMEIYFRKKNGNITGWISYSLSRTEQRFDEINNGLFYPAKYDRRHDIALTLTYKFNEKWSSSAVFIYTSGSAFTMPVGRYIIQGNIVNQYGDVNQFRMPPYHRLDLSLTRKITIKRKWTSELNLSIYNVYNRANPYFIYFQATGDLESYTLKIKALEVTLFPVIPSLSWNFVF